MNKDELAKHHMSEELSPIQYKLSKLLGDYYGYRLENYILIELEEELKSLLKEN